MPEILIAQDEDYVAIFRVYKETCQELPQENLNIYRKQFWDRAISTKDMNVKSMARWLDAIDKYATNQMNIVLVTPADLGWLR